MSKNCLLSVSNLFVSICSFVNAFTTFCPSRLSSMRAFNSPIWFLCLRNTSRILKFRCMHTATMIGTIRKIISVRSTLIRIRMINAITSLTPAIKNSSGQ